MFGKLLGLHTPWLTATQPFAQPGVSLHSDSAARGVAASVSSSARTNSRIALRRARVRACVAEQSAADGDAHSNITFTIRTLKNREFRQTSGTR